MRLKKRHYLVLFMAYALITHAIITHSYERWVLCKSIVSGQVQAFPGKCPRGWIYEGPA